MTTNGLVHNLIGYTYSSPRYNSFIGYPTQKIPTNYSIHDQKNGTFDKWFPLYRLVDTEEPSFVLYNAEGSSSIVKGALTLAKVQPKYFYRDCGAIKQGKERPYNSTLEQQRITYDAWASIKLNPAWCVIQTRKKEESGTTTYEAIFLVRLLGNTSVVENVHTFDLDAFKNDALISSAAFRPGLLVRYKKRIWKCIVQTFEYPPSIETTTTHWQPYKPSTNVFIADVFMLTSEADSGYLLEVTDPKRKFNPATEKDLVCWNAAYFN